MERMINARLVWFLESCTLIKESQTFIRDIYEWRNVASIFFNLDKAYDTTWKYGIMKYLYDTDYRGSLPHFIVNFLSEG